MSFLAGRLAGKEGAYFFQESKQAVGRLVEKKAAAGKLTSITSSSSSVIGVEAQADVLPEVLRHSLPIKISQQNKPADSTLFSNYRGSKWNLPKDDASSLSRDALNPLSAYVSLPQVTFGPKRWELPSAGNSVNRSTANELRHDKDVQVNPDKVKAVAEGFFLIGKAFAVATAVVFGGAALSIGWAKAKYDIQTSDDIRTKGRDIVQPKFESIREQLSPLRNWAGEKNRSWNMKKERNIQEKPIIQELSKLLRAKPSS